MINDRIFISYSNTDEGKRNFQALIEKFMQIKRKYDFFQETDKKEFIDVNSNSMTEIFDKIKNCGVTVLILSSDFLDKKNRLLTQDKNGNLGWNYEELKTSLTWNKEKALNSVIIVYTNEYLNKFLSKPGFYSPLLDVPIIKNNTNNLRNYRASNFDDKSYIETVSLKAFLMNPKFYLNKVDKRKTKNINFNLYDISK